MKLLIDNRLIEFVSSLLSFPRLNSIHPIVFVETVVTGLSASSELW